MMKQFVYKWLLLGALFAPMVVQAVTPEEQQRFADGLYTRKLHEMAIKEYNRIIQDFPDYAQNDQVLYRAGECARRMGQAEQAMAYYQQIGKVFPKSPFTPKADLRQAELHVQRAEYGNAIVLLKKLQESKPPTEILAAARYYQGFSYSKLQQFDKASELFSLIIKEHGESPFSAYAAMEKARILESKAGANADELIALYRKAADKPPSARAGMEAQLALADRLYRAGKFDESSAAFAKLNEKYGKESSAKRAALNAAWAHYNAKAYQRCLDLVNSVDPTVKAAKAADWMYLEANCYRHLKQDATALEKYRALVAAHPGSQYADFAGYEIALVSFARQDYPSVLQQAERMLKQPKLKEDGLWLIAESHRASNKPTEAIKYYQQLVAELPQSARAPESIYQVAQLQQKAKQFGEAAKHYRMVAGKYAQHELAPRSLFAAGFCAGAEDGFAQAVKDWQALISQYPKHELVNEALFQKGLAEMQMKQEPNALTTFKQLLDRKPEARFLSEAAYWRAVMLERANKPTDAEAMLKLSLANQPKSELVPKMQYRLAMVLQKQGKKAESADFLQGLIETGDAELLDAALMEWLVRHRWEEKNFAKALPAARRLTAPEVEEKWRQMGWGLLGYTLQQLGKGAEAATAYVKGLQMESRTTEVVNGALFVGEYHTAEKQYDLAIKDYEATAAIASEVGMLDVQAKAYYGLGAVSELMENWDDAARFFMSVAVLFDDPSLSAESLYRAAQAFDKLGKTKEQKQALAELAERYPNSEWQKRAGQ